MIAKRLTAQRAQASLCRSFLRKTREGIAQTKHHRSIRIPVKRAEEFVASPDDGLSIEDAGTSHQLDIPPRLYRAMDVGEDGSSAGVATLLTTEHIRADEVSPPEGGTRSWSQELGTATIGEGAACGCSDEAGVECFSLEEEAVITISSF